MQARRPSPLPSPRTFASPARRGDPRAAPLAPSIASVGVFGRSVPRPPSQDWRREHRARHTSCRTHARARRPRPGDHRVWPVGLGEDGDVQAGAAPPRLRHQGREDGQ
eukprot:2032522-Prymnesium_polylepis.1